MTRPSESSRPLRFRAWDFKNKNMVYRVNIISGGYAWIGEFGSWENSHCHSGEGTPINGPIMQFTGLLDKNRKEIYEGDIFKHDESYAKYSGLKEIFIVQDIRHLGIEKDFAHGEIIGNIYENPELLKENK